MERNKKIYCFGYGMRKDVDVGLGYLDEKFGKGGVGMLLSNELVLLSDTFVLSDDAFCMLGDRFFIKNG